MKELWQALQQYAIQKPYPFHMPGHKGGHLGFLPESFAMDVTEIEGFDNLQQPEGILLQAQQRCAKLFGAEESFFLVNGSTVGIVTAMLSVCYPNEEVLVARNCHKSVYSALVLSGAKPVYVFPEILQTMVGSLSVDAVKQAVFDHPQAKALFLTSPTYEGITSDIEEISLFLHQHHRILVVDEAHGSHMKFHNYFPKTALEAGADIVIQSLHKTLPCPTQTAVLHVQGNRVNRNRLRQSLSMVQTSSPSYLFLGAVDYCCHLLETEGETLFQSYVEQLDAFYKKAETWQRLRLFSQDKKNVPFVYSKDKGKLVIEVDGITGVALSRILREQYQIELELASLHHVIAMTSIADTAEGFQRLSKALEEIDKQLAKQQKTDVIPISYPKPTIQKIPREAYFAPKKEMLLTESEQYISGSFLIPYPPGIPLVVPGEVLTKEVLEQIVLLRQTEIPFVGSKDSKATTVDVVE